MRANTGPAHTRGPQARRSLRLALTPDGPRSRPSGAWRPHSRDLTAQLPYLTAELDSIEGLLVVPPESSGHRARQLMAAAARPGNRRTALALVADGPTPPSAAAPREHIHILTRRARNVELASPPPATTP